MHTRGPPTSRAPERLYRKSPACTRRSWRAQQDPERGRSNGPGTGTQLGLPDPSDPARQPPSLRFAPLTARSTAGRDPTDLTHPTAGRRAGGSGSGGGQQAPPPALPDRRPSRARAMPGTTQGITRGATGRRSSSGARRVESSRGAQRGLEPTGRRRLEWSCKPMLGSPGGKVVSVLFSGGESGVSSECHEVSPKPNLGNRLRSTIGSVSESVYI